jgi:hypothetical protein
MFGIYPSVFTPWSEALTIVGLFGSLTALLLIARRFPGESASVGGSRAIGGDWNMHPRLFWATTFPIVSAVVFLGLFLIASFVVSRAMFLVWCGNLGSP